ncbi:MAG: alpha/beta hydrolase family protein [Thermoleophilia bacterium]
MPPRPGRLEVRAGFRPGTAFGVDDSSAPVAHLTYRSTDGHTWDALLARPMGRLTPRAEVLVVIVHGSMGNYIDGVPRRAAIELSRAGFAALSVNTRMANFGVVYGGGLLDRTPADLDGALALAADLGFARVAMLGYGQGATMVVHHQALRRPDAVEAACTLAHPASLPDALRRRWEAFGARPSYDAMLDEARARFGPDGSGEDGIVVVAHGAGGTAGPADHEVWSRRAWWASRAPEATHAVSLARVPEMTVPLALIQPGSDQLLGYGESLVMVAREAGVPVHMVRVPSCDHTFWGMTPVVAREAAAWLDATLGTGPTGAPSRPPRVVSEEGPVRHRLVTVTAPDGSRHDALLHVDDDAAARRADRTGRRTAIIHVHGNQGNFSVGSLRFLGDPVAAAGIPLLSLETRLSNVSQLFGGALFEQALDDLAAGVDWLREQGYDAVVVSGYSLGAVLATRFARTLAPPLLRGHVAFGDAWGLPDATRRRMDANGADPSYAELARRCAAAIARGDDPVVVAHRAYGADDSPRHAGVYTAATWWHSRGPEAVDAETHRHIGAVAAPLLLVQGDADVVVEPEEAGRLADVARAAGHADVEVALVPGAGHSFAGHEDEVVAAVVGWLGRVA